MISRIKILSFFIILIKLVPGAGLERATARSSAECSPGLSYPGISAIEIVRNLSLSFENIRGKNDD